MLSPSWLPLPGALPLVHGVHSDNQLLLFPAKQEMETCAEGPAAQLSGTVTSCTHSTPAGAGEQWGEATDTSSLTLCPFLSTPESFLWENPNTHTEVLEKSKAPYLLPR